MCFKLFFTNKVLSQKIIAGVLLTTYLYLSSALAQNQSYQETTLHNKKAKEDNAVGSQRPPPDPKYFVPTLNNTGYMTTHLDSYSQAFVRYASSVKGPVLEVGAAFGVATLAALSQGATVVCNDLDLRHLAAALQKTKPSERSRLQIVPGDFPEGVSLPDNSFEAILICRVLHLFYGPKIEDSIKKAYALLKPGGKLFIVVDTPYMKTLSSFIPEYERRVKAGVEWPGLIENLQDYVPEKDLPKMVNCLDEKTLRRVLGKYGFSVEKASFINRWDFPADRRLDGRESVGIIAYKPKAS